MKNRFAKIFAVVAAIAAIFLVACADGSVYDDDSAIISSESLNAVMMTETTLGSTTKIKAKSFTGVKTLFKFDVNNGITVSYDVELTSGRLKLVVCDDESVIIKVFECTADESTASATAQTITLDAGSYRMRLVGDGAEFEIKSFAYLKY